MGDYNSYIKEIAHLKSLGVLDENSDNMEELNSLLKTLEDLENRVTHSSEEQKEKKDDFSIKIKYVNTSDNEDPNWAKEGDSGFDLRACLPKGETHMVLKPLERALIPTGLYFELPKNYELQVRPRSGHSFKTGLMAILGTVDTGYRGEVKVIMINLSNEEQRIEQGERVAQGVVTNRISTEIGKLVKLTSVNELSTSERGSGGFGSTGKS
jgi:dUTP pyrophosphatase